MASFNRVIVAGNLTRDPELRYIPSGTAVSEIGLAVNDRVKKDNQWVEETTFVDVTLWGRTAEIANEYLSKGSNVLIEGRLKLDTWENKEGEKRSKMKVIAERMQMLGGKGGGGGGGAREGKPHYQSSDSGDFQSSDSGDFQSSKSSGSRSSQQAPPDDDIPF